MTNQQMAAEIAALREDLAKARERIACLEARPIYMPQPMSVLPPPHQRPGTVSWPLVPWATCGDAPRY